MILETMYVYRRISIIISDFNHTMMEHRETDKLLEGINVKLP